MNGRSGDLVSNKKATFNFEILETFETGIVLQGTEIKSLRNHGGSLQESYIKVISNELWLVENALPVLHLIFQEVKVLIVKQIIAMIFGPKNKMSGPNLQQQIPTSPLNNDQILEQVLAAQSMFSLSTSEGNEYGDMEYNLVQLKKQLTDGIVQFTISCQDIKIKLPFI